jgi:hypothetical protein
MRVVMGSPSLAGIYPLDPAFATQFLEFPPGTREYWFIGLLVIRLHPVFSSEFRTDIRYYLVFTRI